MPVNSYHILLMMLLSCSSCVEPFEPVLGEATEVLVINGMITDNPGWHYVDISKSTSYNNPEYVPLSGCIVSVTDENGDMEYYMEEQSGKYSAYLSGSFLAVGKAYSLHVITPDQKEYRSDYDTLTACPPIDTIYYEVEERGTSNPDFPLGGIQFYTDMSGAATDSRNFLWLMDETWEYRSPYVSRYIWRGGVDAIHFHSIDLFKCYQTLPILELHTASTQYLSVNALRRNPLNFVSNETDRLKVKYSLLVKQQSLSKNSFDYWKRMEAQRSGSGGFYETQPASSIGNIYNVRNWDEVVLGIFYATQQQSKRLTLINNFDFKIPSFTCELDTIFDFSTLIADKLPYYLRSIHPLADRAPWETGDAICFDCRIRGGTNEKPDFW